MYMYVESTMVMSIELAYMYYTCTVQIQLVMYTCSTPILGYIIMANVVLTLGIYNYTDLVFLQSLAIYG